MHPAFTLPSESNPDKITETLRMKISLCQIIAIICILAVGFMAASPFVQDAGADGKAHTYIHGRQNIYAHIYCMNGHLLSVNTITTDGIVVSRHKDGEAHKPFVTINHVFSSSTGQSCSICDIIYVPHITSN